MKRCPECRRDYYDDSLLYCLEDGAGLVQGSVPLPDEPATAILPGVSVGDVTGASAAHRSESKTAILHGPGTTRGSSSLAAPRRFDRRLMALPLLAGIVILGGLLGYQYFSQGTGQINSIAVMPFVNQSGNADLEYISDGITDTLISTLSQLPNLSVKAHSSVFRYKGKEADPKTIGRDLNVQAVLNGRVTQRGDQLTLTLELVNSETENVIWSRQYSRGAGDLVSLPTEIARDVSRKLKSNLSRADEQKLAKTYTTNPEAYQLYLKGSFHLSKRTATDMKRAHEAFQQAIDLDPNYALAYAGLSDAYRLPATYGIVPTHEGYPRAKAAAQKALEIDDSLAQAHVALGDIAATYDWDWSTAERELKRAIELEPDSAGPHLAYAFGYLTPMRRFDEAVVEAKRAQELEPLSLSINTNLGAILTTARRYDEAIAQLQKTVALDPNFITAHWRLSLVYSCVGRHNEAIAEAKLALGLAPDLPWAKSVVAGASARAGDRNTALKIIEELKQVSPPNNTSYMIATNYASLGEKDQAFEWLEKAVENKDWSVNRVGVEPWVDNIGSDPRMADVLRRMGLNP